MQNDGKVERENNKCVTGLVIVLFGIVTGFVPLTDKSLTSTSTISMRIF